MNVNLGTLPVYHNQFDQLNQMIASGDLKVADGIEVVAPEFPFVKHYFTFAGACEDGYNWFFCAYASIGVVQLMREDQIAELADKYQLTKIVPFIGSELERDEAIERGKRMLGKKYHWVGRNCENTMNYIQTGRSFSNQTRGISAGVMVGGLALAGASKNKNVQTIGAIISIAALFALLFDLFGENNP